MTTFDYYHQFIPITELDEFAFEFDRELIILKIKIDPIYPIENNPQVKYIFNYLEHINCASFIIEDHYNDKYFLDDFMHFYGNCHKEYKHECKRLHFFSIQPSEIKQHINAILCARDKKTYKEIRKLIQKSYLGFIVIKPIPNVIIGRTLLKTYEDTNFQTKKGFSNKTRHILTLKRYKVHLFGIPLKIRSLLFQQQDTVIAACATVALWSILDKFGDLFGFYSPTPFEITKKANESYSESRMIPSSGLELDQVITTLRAFGCEVEVKEFDKQKNDKLTNYNDFLGFCYAYLRGGIPIYLAVETINSEYHALAVLGYELQSDYPETTETPLVGNRIGKLYVHDDSLGPFAKLEVGINKDKDKIYLILNCIENNDDSESIPTQMFPYAIAVPLYPKIRISYFDLLRLLQKISDILG